MTTKTTITKEQARNEIKMVAEFHYDGSYSHVESNVDLIIDQIYEKHKIELEAKNEKINTVIALCEERLEERLKDCRVNESGQEKAYRVIMQLLRDIK